MYEITNGGEKWTGVKKKLSEEEICFAGLIFAKWFKVLHFLGSNYLILDTSLSYIEWNLKLSDSSCIWQDCLI